MRNRIIACSHRWQVGELPGWLVAFITAVIGADLAVIAVPPALSDRLGMGCIALSLLLVAEFTLVLRLRGLSISQYLASRDPVSGTVYYLMLGVFAIVPLLVARR